MISYVLGKEYDKKFNLEANDFIIKEDNYYLLYFNLRLFYNSTY